MTDTLEEIIKTQTNIGDIYENGYAEVYRKVGIENLGIKNRKGEIVKELQNSNQKQKAKEIIEQYASFEKRPDIKNHAIEQTDIFEVPLLIDKKTDGRGRSGYFKNRTVPIMINYLLNEIKNGHGRYLYIDDNEQNELNTNLTKLSREAGIVNNKFKDAKEKESILKENKNISNFEICKFYYYCKPSQEQVVFKALDSLQNQHSALSYARNFQIIDEDGYRFSSNLKESADIRDGQAAIMKKYGFKYLTSVFYHGIEDKFYKEVIEYVNEKYNHNWQECHSQIQIIVNVEELQRLQLIYELEQSKLNQNKDEISTRFIANLKKRIKTDYRKTKAKADQEIKEYEDECARLEKIELPDELQKLIDVGVYTREDIINEMKPKKPHPYRYPESYLDNMNYLIDKFLIKDK